MSLESDMPLESDMSLVSALSVYIENYERRY